MLVGGGDMSKTILINYLRALNTEIQKNPALDIASWNYPNPNMKRKDMLNDAHPLVTKIIKRIQEGYEIDDQKAKLLAINQEIISRTSQVEQLKFILRSFSGMPFVLLDEEIYFNIIEKSEEPFKSFIKNHYKEIQAGFHQPHIYKLKEPINYLTTLTNTKLNKYVSDVINIINKYNKESTAQPNVVNKLDSDSGGKKNQQKRRFTKRRRPIKKKR